MNIIKIFRAVKSASNNQRLKVLITISPKLEIKVGKQMVYTLGADSRNSSIVKRRESMRDIPS